MRASLLILTLLVSMAVADVRADGCYFPEIAIQTLPKIPSQRALISWKDGKETLVIASTLDSEAQRLGWIIPVPNTPTEISKTTPGTLKTLSLCIQPRIIHDLLRPAIRLTIVIGLAILFMALYLFKRHSLLDFLVIIFIVVLLAGMLLPNLSSAGGTGANAPSLIMEKTVKVGAYEISVLRAQAPQELDSWLTDNGFASLPPAAAPILTDYISAHWIFLAIRLGREEKGLNTPHPIQIAFPSESAIYPMKLTALAGGSPRMDLFVLADKQADSPLLKTVFCDRFHSKDDMPPDKREHYEYDTTEYAMCVRICGQVPAWVTSQLYDKA